MKISKVITIILLLLIVCTMKPLVVAAEDKVELEYCEKNTLNNIFNKSSGKIDTSYSSIALEYYNSICDCSYYDCVYSSGSNYDIEKIQNFISFAQELFGYINKYGDIPTLKKASDKNKNITEFEELINSCYVNDLNIKSYYQCSVNNNCPETETVGAGPGTSDVDCTGFIGEDAAKLIKEILDYVRILGPLAVIIYSALDLARAVAGKYDGNEDALEKAKESINKRVLACLLLLFIPTILKIIFRSIEGAITFSNDCIMIIQNMFLRR